MAEWAYLIPYALLATLSPLGVAATIAVMRTDRLRAFGFGVGVALGQLLACAILVVVGGASFSAREANHPTFEGLLALALGVTLFWLAVVVYRRPSKLTHATSSTDRSTRLLERLEHVHPFTAAVAGLLLGIGGPKRLLLTALAAASITASGVTGSDETKLVVGYSAVATVLVWAPILGYLFLGQWALTRLDRGRGWLTRRQRPITVCALTVLGLVLLGNAVALL